MSLTVSPDQPDDLPPTKLYFLEFDDDGKELTDAKPVVMPTRENVEWSSTAEIFAELARGAADGEPYTDLFILSHGWLNTASVAIRNYLAWVEQAVEQRKLHEFPAGYRPMVICLHWPSDPREKVGRYASQLVQKLVPVVSFYAMKQRAFVVGAGDSATLLENLTGRYGELAEPAPGHPIKLHLMGHSFGAIVVSKAAAHDGVKVDSLFLIEAAMSTWAFAYTHRVSEVTASMKAAVRHVDGVVVASLSKHDRALHYAYMIAEGVRSLFGRPLREPWRVGKVKNRFGALGYLGVSGRRRVTDAPQVEPDSGNDDFGFDRHSIYDVDGSKVVVAPRIRSIGSLASWVFMGSHSNIAQPQMANVYLQSAGFKLKEPRRSLQMQPALPVQSQGDQGVAA